MPFEWTYQYFIIHIELKYFGICTWYRKASLLSPRAVPNFVSNIHAFILFIISSVILFYVVLWGEIWPTEHSDYYGNLDVSQWCQTPPPDSAWISGWANPKCQPKNFNNGFVVMGVIWAVTGHKVCDIVSGQITTNLH